MTTFQELKHLLSLLYIIPSLILYIIILYLIFFSSSKQKFSASFYWIFGFSAINYILHAIVYYFLIRFTAIPAVFPFLQNLPKANFFYPIFYALLYYSGHGIHLYSLMISFFNRFTIFILKTRYDTFWRKYLKYILYLCVFGPLIFIWNFPFMNIKNVEIVGYGAYITATTEFPLWWKKSRNLVFEIAITASISLIMNIYSIFSIVKWRYYDKSNKNSKFTSQDFTMFLYSLLVLNLFFLLNVRMATIDFFENVNNEFLLHVPKKSIYTEIDLNQDIRRKIHGIDVSACIHSEKLYYVRRYVDNNLSRTKSVSSLWNKTSDFYSKPAEVFEFKSLFRDMVKKSKIYAICHYNSSTLSLHIAAYENFVDNGNANEISGIKDENIICGVSLKGVTPQNSFEFSRQLNDKPNEPEIMKFKASRKLLNPNKSNRVEENESLENLFEKSISGLGRALKEVKQNLTVSTLQNPFKLPGPRVERVIEPSKNIPSTDSQKLLDAFSKMAIYEVPDEEPMEIDVEEIVIDAEAMEKNAHLYKNGYFNLKLNQFRPHAHFEALSHLIFWKYSNHKFPPGSFVYAIWNDDAENVPQFSWYCCDIHIANYIDQSLESLKRWIRRQKIEDMNIMFLNKHKRIIISHCIQFEETIEPIKTVESVKVEPIDLVEYAAIVEPVKIIPVKIEPVKVEPVEIVEPVKLESVKVEPIETENGEGDKTIEAQSDEGDKPVEGGEAIEKAKGGDKKKKNIPNFRRKIKRLKRHLGNILHYYEKSDKYDVAENELHEFKIAFQFRRVINIKTRTEEHEWDEAADYKPLSTHIGLSHSVHNKKVNYVICELPEAKKDEEDEEEEEEESEEEDLEEEDEEADEGDDVEHGKTEIGEKDKEIQYDGDDEDDDKTLTDGEETLVGSGEEGYEDGEESEEVEVYEELIEDEKFKKEKEICKLKIQSHHYLRFLKGHKSPHKSALKQSQK